MPISPERIMLRRTKLVLHDASVNQLFANSFNCVTLRVSLLFVPLCREILRKSVILLKQAEGGYSPSAGIGTYNLEITVARQ